MREINLLDNVGRMDALQFFFLKKEIDILLIDSASLSQNLTMHVLVTELNSVILNVMSKMSQLLPLKGFIFSSSTECFFFLRGSRIAREVEVGQEGVPCWDILPCVMEREEFDT